MAVYYHIRLSLLMPFACSGSPPRTHAARPPSLLNSSPLPHFLTFLFLATVTGYRSAGQAFCAVPLCWDLFNILLTMFLVLRRKSIELRRRFPHLPRKGRATSRLRHGGCGPNLGRTEPPSAGYRHIIRGLQARSALLDKMRRSQVPLNYHQNRTITRELSHALQFVDLGHLRMGIPGPPG
uniref:Uncharacterized protein n=1 Tax=Myotis myotis TaxID=51298 RepID=A0A7J7ZWK8_MYOMY|nr:hypothetical protein mMyoMyo1_009575 [Myotis myotis]